jgi:hypothetical protein
VLCVCPGAALGAAVAVVAAMTLAARFGVVAAGSGDVEVEADADADGIGEVEAFGIGVTTVAGAAAADAAGAAPDCAAGDGNAIVPPPTDEELVDELMGAPGEPGSAGSLYDALPKVEVNGEEAKTGRSATVAALLTSPRTSMVVS